MDRAVDSSRESCSSRGHSATLGGDMALDAHTVHMGCSGLGSSKRGRGLLGSRCCMDLEGGIGHAGRGCDRDGHIHRPSMDSDGH